MIEHVADRVCFTVASFSKHVRKPWGGETHLVSSDAPYMAKVLFIMAGKRLSLQVHDRKQETWLLLDGSCWAEQEDRHGNLVRVEMVMRQGYTNMPGQIHRLHAITDCHVAEFSTPEDGTTFRIEDDYGRPDETPEQRRAERGAA